MRRRLAFALLALALGAAPALAQAPDPALVERGEYVARAGDCTSCHTAPEPGSAPFAGGYDIPSPMGPIVSSNITPSKTHGIGNYSLDDFTRAVRKGVAPGGTHLYPAMPYTAYAGVSRRGHRRALRLFHAGASNRSTRRRRRPSCPSPSTSGR